MVAATILYIRNLRVKESPYVTSLKRKYNVCECASGKQALDIAETQPIDAVVLDSASLRSGGERVCRKIKSELADVPLVHIAFNSGTQKKSPADVVLNDPTPRRLVNSLGRFLTKREEEVLHAGPFAMNVPRRILIAHGKETQLTPKQAQLVELFLRSPGKTLARKTIMEKVWDTNYMGDTRTLDVHIRWVRKVLENDTQRPQYLKTVRGVGYKLEVNSNGYNH